MEEHNTIEEEAQTSAPQEVDATPTSAPQEEDATQTSAPQEVDATQTSAPQEVDATAQIVTPTETPRETPQDAQLNRQSSDNVRNGTDGQQERRNRYEGGRERRNNYERNDFNKDRDPKNSRFKKYDKIASKKLVIDYKKPEILQDFLTEKGKLLSRVITGCSAQNQHKLTLEVKRARFIGLLPTS